MDNKFKFVGESNSGEEEIFINKPLENIQYSPAGVWKRLMACTIELIIFLIIITIYGSMMQDISINGINNYSNGIINFINLIPFVLIFGFIIYGLIKDGLFNGHFIGKKIMGLQVVSFNDQTKPCTIKQAIKRNLVLGIVSNSIIGIIIITMQISGKDNRRRWGDGWANTIVIDLNKPINKGL